MKLSNHSTLMHNIEVAYTMIEDLEEQLNEAQDDDQAYDHLELQADLKEWKDAAIGAEVELNTLEEIMNFNKPVYCEPCEVEFA